MPDIVIVARGSNDPRHAADVEVLADRVRDRVRSGRGVGACFLDHHSPSPDDLAAELRHRAVVVPIMVTPSDALQSELSEAARRLGAGGAEIQVASPLGPDPRLLHACEELLSAADVRPSRDTGVVALLDQRFGASDRTAIQRVFNTGQDGYGAWAVASVSDSNDLEAVIGQLRARCERVVAVPLSLMDVRRRRELAMRCRDAQVGMVPGSLATTQALADLVVARSA